ncbi:MAG: DUF4345 domain-containing protein [Salinarimonadaceae bacterium]|nr:MAG: DUF4345 domain-containing protein [Salinarimonadaceae bacterium]
MTEFGAERRALQAAVLVGGCVPVLAGGSGALFGGAFMGAELATDVDSHFRYLSGLLFGIGLAFWSAVPRIERAGALIRLLTIIVVAGGLARGLGFAASGTAGGVTIFALAMELVVTPAICLWQARVARLKS